MRLDVAPGVVFWRQFLSSAEQGSLLAEVLERVEAAPFFRPAMPKTGHPLSVEMTNFGPLGWVTDQFKGYRYEPLHPVTGNAWPDIPPPLLDLWDETSAYPERPEACLVNLYRARARMGLHCDRDEDAHDAPVLSVSLGDGAVFRVGGVRRSDPTTRLVLESGDVLLFGGVARFAYHGVDHVRAGSSSLIPGGGRINLTLRRVSNACSQKKDGRSGG